MPGPQLGGTTRLVRAVLRSPSLRRVMLAYLLFAAVEYGTWIAILLYAYTTLGPESVGAVAVTQLLPSAVFAAAAGSIADRYPRQRVLVVGYGLQAAAFGVTAAGMLLDWSPVAVLAAAVIAACTITLSRPAHWAVLPMLARTPEELTTANGVAGSVEGAGELAGPLAAALVLAVGPPGAVFAAGAVGAAVAMLLVVPLRVHDSGPPVPADVPDADDANRVPLAIEGAHDSESTFRAGIRSIAGVLGDRDSRLIVLLLGARMFVFGCTDVLLVLLALGVLGIGESGAGVLGAAAGVGSILGGVAAFVLVGRRRMAPVLLLGAVLLGGTYLVLGFVTQLLLVLAIIAIGGIGGATLDVAGRTVLQRVADPRTLTRVLGSLEGIGIIALAAGSLLAPIVAEAWGVPVALALAGLVLPVAVAVVWPALRAIDRRVRVPVRELALLRSDRILSPLPAPQLEAVASGARWITLEPGEVLIREGDPGDRYFVLESGSLRIVRQGQVLHEQESERGYGLGEIALLRDVPRTATATATSPSVLLAIARPDFLEAVTGHEQAGAAATRTADARQPAPGPL